MLDESLSPRGPDTLYDLAGSYLSAGSRLLDAGCRDATHLIALVERFDVTGAGVDPVEVHVERARSAIDAAGVADRVEVCVGALEALPFPDAHFDFVWCRDVLEQVDDLDRSLAESARVLRERGRMLVFTTFATGRLTLQDAALLDRHLGNVAENLDEAEGRGGLRTRRFHRRAQGRDRHRVARARRGADWGRLPRTPSIVAPAATARHVLIDRLGRDTTATSRRTCTGRSSSSSASWLPWSTCLRETGSRSRVRYSRAMHPDDLRLLETVGSEAKVASGRVLIEPGQLGSGLYVILEGTVLVEAPEGTRELGAGTLVGECALLSEDGKRTARVRATSNVRVLAFYRVDVERLCADNEGFARRLADY